MKDVIGTADMTQGVSILFTNDQFGKANAALALNQGFAIVPSGIYFNTPQFTISVWVYPKGYTGNFARVMDFGSGPYTNNIVVSLERTCCSSEPFFAYVFPEGTEEDVIPPFALSTEEWQFLTITYDSTYLKFYINADLKASTSWSFTLPTITRTTNYVGKSNWEAHGTSSSYIDDFAFYGTCLSQTQITDLWKTG